jgi:hypothetical protein
MNMYLVRAAENSIVSGAEYRPFFNSFNFDIGQRAWLPSLLPQALEDPERQFVSWEALAHCISFGSRISPLMWM